MKIVTFNVHKCRGMDGRTSAQRIARVLEGIGADIVAVQEIFSSEHSGKDQLDILAKTLGMHTAFGYTRHHRKAAYGNAVLSRWPIVQQRTMDISKQGRERRGCLRADIEGPRGMLHVFNIHLGTSYFERRHQVRSLFSSKFLKEELSGPRVLIGDFNEWVRGLPTRLLSQRFESLNIRLHLGRKRSYPGLLPLLHLDHIYFEKPLHVEKAELVRSRLAKVASDHLPLVAWFEWDS
jgi:endonuclease/exonuclease/phosphatase family metal-dependent hydrolase